MSDQEQIEELYRTYWQCMIGKDVAGLDRIMADDYTLRHMTGRRQSKRDFFRSLTSGELNYYSAEHDEIAVKVFGDTATMIGRSTVEAAVYGGGRNTWRLRGDFTLRKENGVWKLTSSRASTY
jgi:ketosteroid isomerase-like protein